MTWRVTSGGPDLQDADAIGVADGAEAVRDDDGGALRATVRHQRVKRRLHQPLALVVQRRRGHAGGSFISTRIEIGA